MKSSAWLLVGTIVGGAVACASSSTRGAKSSPAAGVAVVSPASSGAAQLDTILRAAWSKRGIVPAQPVDDSRFLRRVYLDVIGRIPTTDELAAFQAEPVASRRAKVVDALLASTAYADRWTRYWDDVLLGPKIDKKFVDREKFDGWLREEFRANVPWDKLVYELVTAKGYNREPLIETGATGAGSNSAMSATPPATSSAASGPLFGSSTGATAVGAGSSAQPAQANGAVNWLLKYRDNPQDLAGAASATFLGVKIQCAQCHDHKTEKWKQADFQRFAACFATAKAIPVDGERNGPRLVQLVESDKPAFRRARKGELASIASAAPTALDGTDFSDAESRREALARWIQSPQNPWFAKAIVNRTWGHFMGRGFVEPIDDFRASNPVVLPELLDWLASDFVAHGFDLKYLVRTITNSEAYQLSAGPTFGRGDGPPLWSRFPLKPLGPDELLDSIAVATDLDALLAGKDAGEFGAAKAQLRKQYEFLFDIDEESHPSTYDGTIPQALMLMNGRPVSRATNTVRQGALIKLLAMPVDDSAKIEALFLRTIARKPTTEELRTLLPLVGVRGADRLEAYEDVFWSLLNSSEFIFNH